MKNIVYLFLFVFAFQFLHSQSNEWDLQQCVEYAQKHNLTLKQSEIQTQINKNNVQQSKATILPTINMGAQHTYNFGRTIDRYTNTFANTQVLSQNFYVSSNVVLWSGLAQYHNIKANQYQYLATAENYQQQVYDLSLNVATAYINVIFSDEIAKISKAQFEMTKEQLARTEKLVNAGALAKGSVYDLQAQLANDEVNVTTANNNYQISILTLTQLMNLDSVKNFTINRPAIDVMNSEFGAVSVQNIYETALKNQHSIKSAHYNLLASEKSLAVARGKVSPTLSATGNIGTGTSELDRKIDAVNIVGVEQAPYFIVDPTNPNNFFPVSQAKTEIVTSKKPFADQFKDNVNKSVGFTLSVPIFNGLQNYSSIKNAKLNTLSAKYNEDLQSQNLYKTIAQAYANAKAALDKYTANKASVSASEQAFTFAQQKFNVGAISTFEYNTTKNRLQNAQSNLVQAKYDYVFKMKVLDYYQGKPLTF